MRPRLGIEVAASSDRAWRELIDLDCWPRWGPTVRSARLDDGSRRLSAGASGSVQTVLGLWLPFRVEYWRVDGPLMSWSWRVAGVPATRHSVISQGPSRCRVEMSVPWWAVPYLGVVGIALRRIRRRAEGVASNWADSAQQAGPVALVLASGAVGSYESVPGDGGATGGVVGTIVDDCKD